MLSNETYRNVLAFAVVGSLAFFVDAGVFTTLNTLGAGTLASRCVSILASFTFTWYLNRTFTFRTTKPASFVEFLSYVGGMQIGLLTNFSTFFVVLYLSDIAKAYPVIALAIATLAGMVINFMVSRRILKK
ncbi:GtrA family protein [uncultured Ruegeria sp.]|uniref:GtrA family protein n=1 Tax=uncultured Ruegeria sp. TaxID=259304 RepID=UPI00261FC714|nr:GtrA family protein [uncultured Ruegeria sp.]